MLSDRIDLGVMWTHDEQAVAPEPMLSLGGRRGRADPTGRAGALAVGV